MIHFITEYCVTAKKNEKNYMSTEVRQSLRYQVTRTKGRRVYTVLLIENEGMYVCRDVLIDAI